MEGELKGGRYLIEQKIKEGGQGIVYRAHDNRLKCHVAVKVVKPEHLDEPQFRSVLPKKLEPPLTSTTRASPERWILLTTAVMCSLFSSSLKG